MVFGDGKEEIQKENLFVVTKVGVVVIVVFSFSIHHVDTSQNVGFGAVCIRVR